MKLILIGAALASLVASQAAAAECGPHDVVLEFLADKYGEGRVGTGIAGKEPNTSTIELFVNPETGTWTAIATGANGMTCRVADGTGWRMTPDGLMPPNI